MKKVFSCKGKNNGLTIVALYNDDIKDIVHD